MTAAEIAAALGGARRSGAWWSCCCPAHDDHSPSLSLRDGHRGLIVRCWAGCDPRDVLAERRRRGLIDRRWEGRDRMPLAATRHDRDYDAARRVEAARSMWNAAGDARGTPVAHYLAARGITIPVPPSVRWAPLLRRPDGGSGPALVARLDNIDGERIGISRTWLCRGPNDLWRRRDRAMLGRAAGGAVRLAPAGEFLMVAEGIETALAGMTATAMPAWAALSTSGLATLMLPPIVRCVVILADNDRSGAGERAARTAAARWLAEGKRLRIALPRDPGTDLADVLAGHGYAQITDASDVAA